MSKARRVVLVVDDDPMAREALLDLLNEEGLEAIGAGDGPEALELARRESGGIDLLLTDLHLPHMSGLELAKRVRELHRGARVVLMTGDPSASGMGVAVARKPIELDALLALVRRELNHRAHAACE